MKRFVHISARVLRAIALTVLLLLVAAGIFLNSNFFDSIIRNQIQTRVGNALNREVTVDSVAFNPFRLDILLRNFRLGNDPRSTEAPFFTASEIYANVSFSGLLGGKVRITEVRLEKPELHITFYQEGGNNIPKTKPKPVKKATGGVDILISHIDCHDMTVVYNKLRQPKLFFSAHDLRAFIEYDYVQNNYLATTQFKNGLFRIQDFEFFQFDLDSRYRIIGNRVSFERLFFLSPRTKFYMAGDMYSPKDPFFDFRFRSRIDLTQTKQMFHFGPEMSGTGNYRAVYKGTFGNFRMQGTGDFRNFTFYSLPIRTATFDLDMTQDWLSVSHIKAGMFDGTYKGAFSIAPLKGNSIFKTNGDWENLDGRKLGDLIRMKNLVLPVKASGKASIHWTEATGIRNLTGDFRFATQPYESSSLDLAAQAEGTNFDNGLFARSYYLPVTSETTFRIQNKQLQDLRANVQTPYTDFQLQGTIDFSGEANLQVDAHNESIPEIDLLFHHLQAYFGNKPVQAQEFWAVNGAADFSGRLDATVWNPFQPRLTGTVHARDVLYHGVPWDHVRADIQLYGKLIDIFDSDLSLGDAVAKAKARFFLEDKIHRKPNALEMTASVSKFPAKEIAHAFGQDLPVNGNVNAVLELHGPFSDLEGKAEFEALQGDIWGEKYDRGAGTVLFFPDSLGLRDITAHLDGGYAKASGDLVYETDEYTVEFSAENVPLEKLTLLKQNGLTLTGVGSASGSGKGTFLRPQLEGNIQISNLTYKGETYGNVESAVSLNRGKLILGARGTARGITSTAAATLDLDGNLPLQAEFNIEKFPVEVLTHAYAPETEQLTGLIGGKFQLTGTLRPAHIEHVAGSLDFIQLDVLGIRLQQARPLNVILSDDVIQIKDSLLTGNEIMVSLNGNIYPKEDNRLDLNLSAQMGLANLSNWDKDITANGVIDARMAIAGTFEQPSLTGIMEIKDGFFRHFSFPNSLTEIAALVTFKNRNINIQSFQANSSGGKLTLGGSATLKGYSLDQYRFDLFAEKIRVHYPEGLRSTVTGELHLQTQKEGSYLTGDIDVLQGVYTQSFEESPNVFGYARVPSFGGLGSGASDESARPTNLNVHIRSDGNILVRNNFANIQSSANLTLTGTMSDPVLVGRLEVTKGVVTFQDREYTVVRGSLDFSNPYRTDPVLNFIAETRVREYRVNLTFNGTFDRIYHELSSDPPLPRDDLYVLLGAGIAPGQGVPGVDLSTYIAGQEISRFITNPIASPLEKGFRQVFGLQKFQIDPVYVQSSNVATARITVQKDISSDFSITYSTNLFTTAEEIFLFQYQLTDQIQITASKDEQSRYGIDVLVTKTFE